MAGRLIGAVTIGQSPRDDVVLELLDVLGQDVRLLQCGALDGLSLSEVHMHKPTLNNQVLVSRMADGTEVQVDKSFVHPRVQACIWRLEADVELLLLLCTAPFHGLQSKRPVMLPGRILEQIVSGLQVNRLGILTPSGEQIESQRDRWRELAHEVVVAAASPYGDVQHVRRAATELASAEVDLAVMDCIGYTRTMKGIVREVLDRPVMLASRVLARVAAELIE